MKPTPDVIDEFVRQYEREYDFYFEAARTTARRCEVALSEAGVRSLVTFRAKRSDRLRVKLQKRDVDKHYADLESIRNDIVDLAGVRIALYFPGDQLKTRSFVESTFDIEPNGWKLFPDEQKPNLAELKYESRFPGYCANHYRVRNRIEDLSTDDSRYAYARVEIQIASVLMLAWQEVDHDLRYKPLSGSLSEDELAILDEVNGLVIAGEIAFERLQRAVERRLSDQEDEPFVNHYDLASYLDKRVRSQNSSAEVTP